jgi:hypothetical protein
MQPAEAFGFSGSSRFLVRSRVGEGAVGVVYDAFDRERVMRVAIKTLRSPSAQTIHMLKREFRALADLRHPNLVELGELFEEHGTWFFTMEFVQGVHLLRHVRPGSESRPSIAPPGAGTVSLAADRAAPDENRLRAAFRQLARGLSVLHAANKVHCDVKPSNVMVTSAGRVVILDFGLVAEATREAPSDEIQGTIAYMAPEQAASEQVGGAADWYALGVMLYQALTGRLPFYGTAGEVLEQKVTREPPPPRELWSGVPQDLDKLCADLLRMDPVRRPRDAEILARLGVEDAVYDSASFRAPIFVGRGPEQEALRQAFADVENGAPATVFVHGESGVGKSFLVRRFAERIAKERGAMVLSGRCYERESVAYKAVDGVVDDLSERLQTLPEEDVVALLPPHVGLLLGVFPVLGKVEAIERAAAQTRTLVASPQQLRAYVFAALRNLLDGLARRQPLVVVVDDLQWADNDSLVLLSELTRPPAAPPFLLVATMRLATESHRPTGLRLAPAPRIGSNAKHLHLEHLSEDDAERLVAGLLERLPDGAASRGAIRSIVADTKGHPLFIDELVRQGGGRGRTNAPLKLDDALWARVSRLDPSARKILEVVATAGLPIPQGVAAQASATELGDLFRLVSALRSEHFVRTAGVGQLDFIEPYHDRVREAVLARLEPSARKDWHARLALALEGWSDADPESLSTHWEAAGRSDRAQHYAVSAAAVAEKALAFDRAARLYRRALELTQSDEARTTIQGKLAEALTNAGCWADAAEVRLALARGAGATTSLDLRRTAAEQLMCSGHFDRGVQVLRAALSECGVRDPRSAVGLIVALIVHRLLLAIRGLEYVAREPTEALRPELVRADTVRSAGAGFSMTDNVRGAYFQTRNLLMTLRTGDPHRIARAQCMEVCFSAAGGPAKLARTVRLLESARALCEQLGTGESLGMLAVANGYRHYFVAEWAEAAEWLSRAEEIFRDKCVGMTFELNSARLMLYRAISYRGDLRDLAARAPAAYREAEEHGDLYTRINLRAGPLALLGLVQGEPERVRKEVDEVIGLLAQSRFLVQHYFCMVARTQADLYEGHGRQAHERVEGAWPALRRSMLLTVLPIRVLSYEQRGRCALAVGATAGDDRLIGLAEAQANKLRRIGLDWAQGSAQLLLAGVRAARGAKDAARLHALEAVRVFEQGKMGLYAAAARRRLGELSAEGDPEGARAMALSDAWMQEQGVRDPASFATAFAPGFSPR